MTDQGLLDTSVFIASEFGRELRHELLPARGYVCVVTVAELHAGVLAARDLETRARRLATSDAVAAMSALPIDESVARQWAKLRVQLYDAGRRLNVNDLWVAATALANGLPVVTQDDDFDALADLKLLDVIRV